MTVTFESYLGQLRPLFYLRYPHLPTASKSGSFDCQPYSISNVLIYMVVNWECIGSILTRD